MGIEFKVCIGKIAANLLAPRARTERGWAMATYTGSLGSLFFRYLYERP